MKTVVFGANGRLGKYVVEGLLARGDHVRAFVHLRDDLPRHGHLEVHRGDVHEITDVAKAVSGVDVVVSCLGSMGAPIPDVSSVAITHLIPAMKAACISRIISVTGSGAYDEGEETSPHPFLRARHDAVKARMPQLLADGERHLRILRQSDLHWTALRAPMLTADEPTTYALSLEPAAPSTTLPYRAVAAAIIALAPTQDWLCAAPFVKPATARRR